MTKHNRPQSQNEFQTLLEAPNDEEIEYGLWIAWNGRTGTASFELLPDKNLANLHRNIHTPACIGETRLLKGGGSGTTVFAGELFSEKLVWKHGGQKDTGEVFALAEIEHELLRRSAKAADELRSRIPCFRGVYLSPHHFRVRSQELWTILRQAILKWAKDEADSPHNSLHGSDHSLNKRNGRQISLCKGQTRVDVHTGSVRVFLEDCDSGPEQRVCGYDTLKVLVSCLRELQAKHFWKFSLAQSTIGGQKPRTASSLLISGELVGDTLHALIDQFFDVLRALQELALPCEKNDIETVRKEIDQITDKTTAADVSPLLDSFVGKAIRKNWHPIRGRLHIVREIGFALNEGSLVLTPKEELPGKILSVLVWKVRARMSDIFATASIEETLIFRMRNSWRGILRHAASLEGEACTHRIWTCGLTDAGLHNMFFSDGRLWLFDLGEPSLQPLPAFLTKFLMSFFHALGMEETSDGKSWVNRFVESTCHKLEITDATKVKLSSAYEAFDVALDRLVVEIFKGEEAVRGLLVKYVIVQLMSDAAFCLKRWQTKGGGSKSYDNHHTGLEKWLWRAIWDMYVATDVSHTYSEICLERETSERDQ